MTIWFDSERLIMKSDRRKDVKTASVRQGLAGSNPADGVLNFSYLKVVKKHRFK
jgi:hypothetical protein